MNRNPAGYEQKAKFNSLHKTPQYRIGDYAKYLGVTPDFLKHYEQFRLISSEPKENGYRYYPFEQSYKILECMRLRSYGIPLRDMDAILNSDNAETIIEKLDMRADAMERQIRVNQAIVSEQHALSRWFRRMDGREDDWNADVSEEMLFLPHTSRFSFLKDERIYDILGDWLALMPIVKSCMRIPLSAGCDSSTDYAWGLIVPAATAERFSLPVNGAVLRLPQRKTFFYHFSGKRWAQLDPQTLTENDITKKMSQHGLVPSGDIYMTIYMHTHVDSRSALCGYYAAPIE